nr:ribonuclease H-like domain-containing protein [Tanacetum cinerariifolium]
ANLLELEEGKTMVDSNMTSNPKQRRPQRSSPTMIPKKRDQIAHEQKACQIDSLMDPPERSKRETELVPLGKVKRMRIEQYFLMTDYSLWEVILNGDSPAPTRVIVGVVQPVAPTTAEQRLQKLISQLEVLGESLSQENINLKFLRSLPTEWRTHTLIWRNKKNLEEQSLDDFFNNLKIYEIEVKSSSSASTSTQNIGFVSSQTTDSTNEPVSAVASVSAASEKLSVSALLNVDTLSNARTGRNLKANGPTSMGFDMSKVECYNYHRKRECRSPKDTRRNVAAEPQRRNVLKRNQPTMPSWNSPLQVLSVMTIRQKFKKAKQERDDLKLKLEKFQTSSKNLSQLLASQTNDKTGLGYNTQVFTSSMFDYDEMFTSETDKSLPASPIYDSFVQPTEQVKTPSSSVKTVETSIPATNYKTSIPKPTSNGNSRNRKACFVCKSLTNLIKDCDYYDKKVAQTPAMNHAQRGNHHQYAIMTLLNFQRHVVPTAVLTKSKLVPITAARPVTAVVPKTHVTRPRPTKSVVTKPHSPPRRNIKRRPSPKASTFPPKVTAAKAPMVNAVKGNWDKGVIDSGCSRHMTGNMSYLSDFEELNGGYVAFGGNPNGGKISGKEPFVGNQDPGEKSSQSPSQINHHCCYGCGDSLEDIFCRQCTCELCGNGAHYGYDCPPKEEEKQIEEDQAANARYWKIPACYDDNDDDYTFAITPNEPDNSLSLGDEHLDTVPVMESDEFIKSSVENLVPIPSESEGDNEYDVPACEVFTTFSNILFDSDYDFHSNPHPFNAESDLIESLLNHDSSIISSFSNIDSLFDEFAGKLTLLKSIPSRIDETDCDPENSVLVTKPQNKISYELLLGRTPSISFIRPFGCPMTILNILDPLGKFDGKVDEGFLVGYSVRRNQSNPSAGVQEQFDTEKAREESVQQYVLFPLWSSGSTNPQNTDDDAAFGGEKPEIEGRKPEFEVYVSPSSSAQTKKHDDKTNREAKGKSPVESSIGYRILSVEFKDFSDNNINEVNAANTLVPAVRQISTNSTNTSNAAGPSNADVSPIHGKSSYVNTSQYHDYLNMPELEDITYFDDEEAVGAEADFTNLKTTITVSPIPTTRVHKDNLVTQIIGDLSSATQTRSMTKVTKDQGFEDPDYPDKVYKVVKAFYGLHQAPRAWYETLVNYLLENGFQRGKIDQTLFIKRQKDGKSASTPIDTEKPLLMDSDGEDVNDVTRLQALVDKKKVIITEGTIRDALRLDDAESIDCLPNEKIFTELSRMRYEKPSTKLTFYKAFFSPKWKFLIHTILQCMSAKWTLWNEFSSSMALAVICLSTGRKFNFSKAQVGDLSSHSTKYSSPALTQKVFANMRRVGNGFSRLDTPFFEGKILAQQDDAAADEGAASVVVDDVPATVDEPSIPSPTPTTQPPPPSQDLPFTSQVQPTTPPSPIAQPPSPQQQLQPSHDAEI